jgi:hypothetical protein
LDQSQFCKYCGTQQGLTENNSELTLSAHPADAETTEEPDLWGLAFQEIAEVYGGEFLDAVLTTAVNGFAHKEASYEFDYKMDAIYTSCLVAMNDLKGFKIHASSEHTIIFHTSWLLEADGYFVIAMVEINENKTRVGISAGGARYTYGMGARNQKNIERIMNQMATHLLLRNG